MIMIMIMIRIVIMIVVVIKIDHMHITYIFNSPQILVGLSKALSRPCGIVDTTRSCCNGHKQMHHMHHMHHTHNMQTQMPLFRSILRIFKIILDNFDL